MLRIIGFRVDAAALLPLVLLRVLSLLRLGTDFLISLPLMIADDELPVFVLTSFTASFRPGIGSSCEEEDI